jgi:hypothetical protein
MQTVVVHHYSMHYLQEMGYLHIANTCWPRFWLGLQDLNRKLSIEEKTLRSFGASALLASSDKKELGLPSLDNEEK